MGVVSGSCHGNNTNMINMCTFSHVTCSLVEIAILGVSEGESLGGELIGWYSTGCSQKGLD